MANNNAVNTTLSGQSGTGAFAGSTSPTLTTPNIGVATATSLTFTDFSTGGVLGTSTNNSASTGYVGEYVSNSASGVALTTGTPKTIASISLTAGDWDVWCGFRFAPNAGTTISAIAGSVSSTDNTLEGSPSLMSINATLTTAQNQYIACGTVRKLLSATTTIYAVAQSTFGVSTMTAETVIAARRRR